MAFWEDVNGVNESVKLWVRHFDWIANLNKHRNDDSQDQDENHRMEIQFQSELDGRYLSHGNWRYELIN
jgi:hypothetical protein